MTTLEKIKAGLKCCTSLLPAKPGECPFAPSCDECSGDMELKAWARVLILQNEQDIIRINKELDTLRNEKSALLADLKEADLLDCVHCAHYKYAEDTDCDASDCDCGVCEKDCPCRSCRDNSNWEWRGIRDDGKCTE